MLLVIIKKELKRVFTDKRLVFSAFILPALSIFILYTILGKMMGGMEEDIETHMSKVYVQNAPETFINYYDGISDELNMELSFDLDNVNKDTILEDIRNGDVDLYIEFEENFDDKVIKYKSVEEVPDVKTFYNPSEEYSDTARMNFVERVLSPYEKVLLVERFGNINDIRAFSIDAANDESIIVDDNKAAGVGLSMILPMLLAIMLFSGAMGIGLDTIAGEKERGTMATLLLTPVNRDMIALGKVISLGIVAVISALCSFGAIIASMPNASELLAGGMEGVKLSSISFSPLQYVQLLVIMISLVAIYVGLICLVSVKAKSVKEAGTYIAPIYMVIMVAAFATMFSRGDVELLRFAIPVMGNVFVIKKILMFELAMSEFLVSTGVSILVAAVLIKLITITFNNEKTMFNA